MLWDDAISFRVRWLAHYDPTSVTAIKNGLQRLLGYTCSVELPKRFKFLNFEYTIFFYFQTLFSFSECLEILRFHKCSQYGIQQFAIMLV
jgi:hypothetical protein